MDFSDENIQAYFIISKLQYLELAPVGLIGQQRPISVIGLTGTAVNIVVEAPRHNHLNIFKDQLHEERSEG